MGLNTAKVRDALRDRHDQKGNRDDRADAKDY